ncbi:MAG TPA: calcium/sodium antiporter, partial [Gammaproteobacteria bacterium]
EIAIGLLLLFWGADRLVIGAAATARNLGVSAVLVGLVVVGFATSAPEMLISALAAMDNAPALAVGNALGSNIANLGLVLGTAVLICPLAVHSQTLRREFPAVVGVTVLATALLLDRDLSRLDAFVLLGAMVAMTAWIIKVGSRSSVFDPLRTEYEDEIPADMPAGKATFWLVVGLVTVLVGAELMVNGATDIALLLGVSELVLGVTIVAVGTSLPELAVAIAGAVKREADLVLGNVLGSNIFNLLAVVGIAGAIRPHELESDVITLHLPLMGGLTLAVFLLAYNSAMRVQLTRPIGVALLAIFLIYQGFVVSDALM